MGKTKTNPVVAIVQGMREAARVRKELRKQRRVEKAAKRDKGR